MRRPLRPDHEETGEDRRARAAALQDMVLGKTSLKPKVKPATERDRAEPLLPLLAPESRAALQGMTLHGRRYGLDPVSRTHLRRMGCRNLADVAEASYGKCVNWLGYAQADTVRDRVREIEGEIRAGAPEPGIRRIASGLGREAREWLGTRPIEDVGGRGISAKVVAALRAAGHASLAALATEEVDGIEDIQGIGPQTVSALRVRISDILAESEGSPTRGIHRTPSADDAEWEAASPSGS